MGETENRSMIRFFFPCEKDSKVFDEQYAQDFGTFMQSLSYFV